MSVELIALIGVIAAGVLAIIQKQQAIYAELVKSNADIAKLKADSDAHVIKKDADIKEVGERSAANSVERMFEQVAAANEQAMLNRQALVGLTERQVIATEKQTETLDIFAQNLTTLSLIVQPVNTILREFEAIRQTVGKFEKPDNSLVLVLQKVETDIAAIEQYNGKRREIDTEEALLRKTVITTLKELKDRINQIPNMPPEVASVTETPTVQNVQLIGTIGEVTKEDKPAA